MRSSFLFCSIHYDGDPIGDVAGSIVLLLDPGAPPVIIRSLGVETTPNGFRVVISTDLPKRSTFSLGGGMLYSSEGSPTRTYELVIQGAILDRGAVQSTLPSGVTVSKGLPSPYMVSLYSASLWRALPKKTSTSSKPGENAYTMTLGGISPDWTLTTAENQGEITLTITK